MPRALVPEIERAVRLNLHENLVDRRLNIKDTLTRGIDDLPMSSACDLSSETLQSETLENHLYEQVKNEADRTELAANSIPNRHAAIHGLVPYSTEKSSLNSIFLTDFVFHIITEMKREIIKDVIQILNNMVGPVSWTAAR